MKTQYFSVPVVGIGRRDYSEGIEFATQASFRGHQARINWADDYIDVPTIPFPFSYGVLLLFFDATGALVSEAPDIPYHIFSIIVTSERAGLVTTGLYRFASLADAMIWNVEKWYGDVYGYGKAELLYTAGIKTAPGKVYVVPLAEYSEQPTFSIHSTITALEEEVIYG